MIDKDKIYYQYCDLNNVPEEFRAEARIAIEKTLGYALFVLGLAWCGLLQKIAEPLLKLFGGNK